MPTSLGDALLRVAVIVLLSTYVQSGRADSANGTEGVAPVTSIERVAQLLSGSFSSAAQARVDTEYRDVRLRAAQIWPERQGEHWLYVEQALATELTKPYRQRVYHLVQDDHGVRSVVFELPGDPLTFAGGWSDVSRFSHLTPADLFERVGCSITLQPVTESNFRGSTRGHKCVSHLRGAWYVTSDVMLAPDRIESLDRGFDAKHEQVWGAERGPYLFLRE